MEKFDLIVAGGGLTGVAAAVSAAREGLRVLLVEASGGLGGAMTVNLVYPFMRFWTKDPQTQQIRALSGGIFKEMNRRQEDYIQPMNNTRFNPNSFQLLLDDMCVEAGVQVLFHATLCGADVEGRCVKSVLLATKAGLMSVSADSYIDATGDGDLMAFAGCAFQTGREGDGLCQPMTTIFRMSNVDVEGYKADRSRIQELYKQHRAQGKLINPREDILTFYGLGEGIVHFNTTRMIKLDPTDPFDVSRAEMEGRKQIFEMYTFLKENCPSFKDADICSVAVSVGVRESRKLVGEHVLTVEELKNCTRFEDSVALGNYDVDIHNPEGAGTSHYYFPDGEYYTIPYRSFLPKELDNLLVAGRCLSTTHEAQASVRIMPICATMGEAAGVAAAVAKQTGTCVHGVDVKLVQKKLREKGAVID